MLRETHLPPACLLSFITHLHSWLSTNLATITSQRVPKTILGLHPCTKLGSPTPGTSPLSSHLSCPSDRSPCLAESSGHRRVKEDPTPHSAKGSESLLPPTAPYCQDSCITLLIPELSVDLCLVQYRLLEVWGGNVISVSKKNNAKMLVKVINVWRFTTEVFVTWHTTAVSVQCTHCITTGMRHSGQSTSFSKCG